MRKQKQRTYQQVCPLFLVGVMGLEPMASWSRTKHSYQTELHPDVIIFMPFARHEIYYNTLKMILQEEIYIFLIIFYISFINCIINDTINKLPKLWKRCFHNGNTLINLLFCYSAKFPCMSFCIMIKKKRL